MMAGASTKQRAKNASKMDVATDQEPSFPQSRCRGEMGKWNLFVFVIAPVMPTVLWTPFVLVAGNRKRSWKKMTAHSRSINHWKKETLPCEAGDSTWHHPDGEPRYHKSPGLCQQQPRPLAWRKGGGCFAGTGAGVCLPMDTGPFCVSLGWHGEGSRVGSYPGNLARWPGRDGMSLASSL